MTCQPARPEWRAEITARSASIHARWGQFGSWCRRRLASTDHRASGGPRHLAINDSLVDLDFADAAEASMVILTIR
jgi:hypothetical protein